MKKLIDEPDEPQPVNTEEEEVPSVYMTPQEPTKVPIDLPMAKVIPHTVITEEVKKRMEEHPENFRAYNSPFTAATTVLYGLNNLKNSRWKLIREIAKSRPGGPYSVRGSDGKITIHNGQHNQGPMLAYTWDGGNGELFTFDITDDFIESQVELSSEANIDGDTKEVNVKTTQTSSKEIHYKTGELVWVDKNFWTDDKLKPKWNEKDKVAVNTPYLSQTTYNNKGNKNSDIKKAVSLSYNSEQDAKTRVAETHQLTQDDVDTYLSTLQKQYQSYVNASNSGDIQGFMDLLRKSNTLEDYVVKKKVLIKKSLNPLAYSGVYDTPQYKKVSQDRSTDNIDYSTWWYEGFKIIIAAGYTIVPKRENYPAANNYGYSAKDLDNIIVLEEQEVEVPISGARVLASPFVKTSTSGIGGDIVKKTENEVTATASIFGNPTISCSRVLTIDNVGKRYSGDWYIKKVTHEISNGDYTCSLDFKKKSLLISKVTYDQKIPTQNIYVGINKTAQESLVTGKYKIPAAVKAAVEKVRNSSTFKGKTLRVEIVSETPLKIAVYDADVRFNVSKPMVTYDFDEKGDIK